jgi:uncharacterized protein with HEPN domain
MSRDADQRLEDIIEACDRVADYILGFDQASFDDDARTSPKT